MSKHFFQASKGKIKNKSLRKANFRAGIGPSDFHYRDPTLTLLFAYLSKWRLKP